MFDVTISSSSTHKFSLEFQILLLIVPAKNQHILDVNKHILDVNKHILDINKCILDINKQINIRPHYTCICDLSPKKRDFLHLLAVEKQLP